MAKIQTSATINRPVEAVWKFINDLPRSSEWDEGVIEAKQTSAGPPGVGATFQSKRKKEGLITFRCAEYEPNKKLALEFTNTPFAGSTESLSLESLEGKARLTWTTELKFGGAYRIIGPFLLRSFRRLNETQLNNLKRVMESEGQ